MSTFEDGYNNFIRLSGGSAGAYSGDAYVGNVQAAIDKLEYAINHPGRIISNPSTDKGFLAERWHEGTFNIDAALKDSKVQAIAPDDNGIVDVVLTSGEKYQLKYYKTASKSATELSKTNLQRYKEYAAPYERSGQKPPMSQEEYFKHLESQSPNDPYYLGQGRLVPTEQLEEAKNLMWRKFLEESNGGRPEQAARYKETFDMLSNRLKSTDGTESIPLTNEESQKLAELAMEEGFDPAEWGLMPKNLIKMNYIMQQAVKAGLSAALISVVLNVAPEICGIIGALIERREIKKEQFKSLGFKAVSGSAEGFIRGSVAGAITVACESGMLGSALQGLNPGIIGAVTAITMETIKNACLLAFGKISKYEFADRCCQNLVVTACSVGLGIAAGAIGALLSPVGAVLGYMIGSFVGAVVGGFIYKGISNLILSLCIKNGWTFFGLVEQNYELPPEILKEIGFKVFEYEKYEPKIIKYDTYEPKTVEYDLFEPIKIKTTFLRRGVIGVRTIGYIWD